MDRITLKGVEVFAHHGAFESERDQGQTFVVDVEVVIDLSEARASDELEATLDYGWLAAAIYQRVSSERWNLIERVAERVSDIVLADTRVEKVVVTIHKPEAPIPVEFEDVSVTIERSQP
jgi:dihydroneopterin aldolase